MTSIWKTVLSNNLGYRLLALKTGYIVKKPYGYFDYIVHLILFSSLSYYFTQRTPLEPSSLTNITLFIIFLIFGHVLLDRFILGVSIYVNFSQGIAMSGRTYHKIKLKNLKIINDEQGGISCAFCFFEDQNSSDGRKEILWVGQGSSEFKKIMDEVNRL